MIIVGEAQMVAGAKLDFTIDWSERLGGDTLANGSWATISGLTRISSSISGDETQVRYTSANVGAVYLPNVTATFGGGDTPIAAFRLEIVSRIVVQDLALATGAVITLDALPWAGYLEGDAIVGRAWSSSGAGLTITSGGTTATPKVTAAATGTWYATEHVTTASGQEDERSIAIVVRDL